MALGPDLSRLSINQLCELTGRSHRYVKRRLAEAGVEPVGEDGRSRLYPAPEALFAVLGSGADGSRLDPRQERARLDRLRSDWQALKNARERGELVPGSDLDEAMEYLVVMTRQRLLAIPNRTALEHAQAGDSPAAHQDITAGAVREALEDLSDAAGEARKRLKASAPEAVSPPRHEKGTPSEYE